MELGAFSVSLAVKDLAASQAFYEKLGFVEAGGVAGQGLAGAAQRHNDHRACSRGCSRATC